MQRTEINTYDDIAWREDRHEIPAVIRQVSIDGKSYEIDLSPENDAKHLQPLRDLLATYGRPVRVGDAGQYPCEHPGCGERYEHGTSRAAHYRKDHPNWTPPGKANTTPKTTANGSANGTKPGRAARRSTTPADA